MRTIKLSEITPNPRRARKRLRNATRAGDRVPDRIGGRWVFAAKDKASVMRLIK